MSAPRPKSPHPRHRRRARRGLAHDGVERVQPARPALARPARARAATRRASSATGGPNPAARALASGRSGSLGLVFDYSLTAALTDPATAGSCSASRGECEARALGLTLVPLLAGADDTHVRTALVDGFVLYSVTRNDARLRAVQERHLPVRARRPRAGGRRPARQHRRPRRARARWPSTSSASAIATSRSSSAGSTGARRSPRRRPTASTSSAPSGWPAGATGSRPPGSTRRRRSAPARATTARPAASPAARLLDRPEPPTAVLAFSDLLALGVMDAAAERGLDVPGAALRGRLRRHRGRGRGDPAASPPSASRTTRRAPPRSGSSSTPHDRDSARPPRRARRPFQHRSSSPGRSPMILTGSGQIDAQRAFTRLARARRRASIVSRLAALHRVLAAARLRPRRTARRRPAGGIREIPLDAISGTLEPSRAAQFDSDFRPAPLARARWERVWLAEHRGAVLPPITVVAGRRRVRDPRRAPPRLGRPRARRPDDRRDRRRPLLTRAPEVLPRSRGSRPVRARSGGAPRTGSWRSNALSSSPSPPVERREPALQRVDLRRRDDALDHRPGALRRLLRREREAAARARRAPRRPPPPAARAGTGAAARAPSVPARASAVISTGGTSSRKSPAVLDMLLSKPPWLLLWRAA